MRIRVLAGVVVAEVLAVAAYVKVVRPRLVRWGATDAEVAGPLPGDEVVPEPRTTSTRAVDIGAPPQDVWPWLVQIGQDRGGLYSYDWLENLLGLRFHSADRPHPEWELELGDVVRLTPEDGGGIGLTVVHKDPPGALVLAGLPAGMADDGDDDAAGDGLRVSWAFVVRPRDGGSRLLVRWRSSYPSGLANDLANRWLLEPVHFVMERKMLLGIADRAERIVHEPVWPLTAEQLEEVPGFTMAGAPRRRPAGPARSTPSPARPTPPGAAGGP
jgi:hypothetical protein